MGAATAQVGIIAATARRFKRHALQITRATRHGQRRGAQLNHHVGRVRVFLIREQSVPVQRGRSSFLA